MIHQPGVYMTEKCRHPILVSEDHEVVFLTPCHQYGWTRDGAPNSPDTRRDHGRIVRMLWALAPPPSNDHAERCPHGIRRPHECRECEAAISPDEVAAFQRRMEQEAAERAAGGEVRS